MDTHKTNAEGEDKGIAPRENELPKNMWRPHSQTHARNSVGINCTEPNYGLRKVKTPTPPCAIIQLARFCTTQKINRTWNNNSRPSAIHRQPPEAIPAAPPPTPRTPLEFQLRQGRGTTTCCTRRPVHYLACPNYAPRRRPRGAKLGRGAFGSSAQGTRERRTQRAYFCRREVIHRGHT